MSSPLTLRERALEIWERGIELQMERDLDGAIALYLKSLETYPTAEAHTFLGWAKSWQGDIDGAISECKRAIEVDPDFGNPYNDIGAYLIEKGELEAAIEWLERAKRAPRYDARHFPHLNLGRVYVMQHRVSLAIRELTCALELNPGDPAATEALSKLRELN